MHTIFRRLYSTQPSLPELARVARTSSTPRAVRLRRQKQFGKSAASDATKDGLTPTEQARYTRFKAQGLLVQASGKNPTEAEWQEKLNSRRSRIRGFAKRKAQEIDVLGKRVYLPNIVFRLVRNHTPPGQPYNPYEATFRIPQSVTKTDIRSLLLAVYGVRTTYIRTDNYISPYFRSQEGLYKKSFKTYKRAVVGLVDPFYYPHRLEDMAPPQRKEREEFIEQHFQIQRSRRLHKEELLRMTKGQGRYSWRFNAPYATKKSHKTRLLNERRDAKERLISGFVAGMRSLRREGEEVGYQKLKQMFLKGSTTSSKDVSNIPESN